jgi:hypothetical protein
MSAARSPIAACEDGIRTGAFGAAWNPEVLVLEAPEVVRNTNGSLVGDGSPR